MAAARATRGRPHVLMHYIISMVVTGHSGIFSRRVGCSTEIRRKMDDSKASRGTV
jgi:hypothetical protein